MCKKRLEDYTLGEIQEICRTDHCVKCPVGKADGSLCPLGGRPDKWRLRFLTTDELELLRLTGARYVSRDRSGSFEKDVFLWGTEPEPDKNECFYGCPGNRPIGRLSADMFPSIKCGDLFSVNELLQD